MTTIRLCATVPGKDRQHGPWAAKRAVETPYSGARALALAHFIDDLLESGRVSSAAEVANALGITRARVSQVMALLRLSARLQEELLVGELVIPSRGLRPSLRLALWEAQEVLHGSDRH